MNESTALMVSNERELTPQVFHLIREMAPIMFKSKLFGVHSEDEATAIMLKGFELGISITASFEFVQVVMGKPGLSPRGALALLHNSPEITKLVITRLEDKNQFVGYECTIGRKNGFEYTSRFTMADAKRAGLIKPDSGWEHYPEQMCQWRAVGFAADVAASDITGGMTGIIKMPEQLGVEINDHNQIIDLQVKNVPAPVEAAPIVTLDQLIDLFGADAVLAANGGVLPMSDDQVSSISEKLLSGVS